jgi:DNA-binding IclR family transcriptional regulator
MTGELVVDDHTVVGRALAVIEAVAQCGPRVTLAEMAAVTGIPKPTIFRIATSLVERGLLDRTDGRFTLGAELTRLGEKAALQREFERYVPVLEELHAAHGGVAWLTAGSELVKMQPVVQVCDSEFVPIARHGWPAPGSAAMLATTAGGHLVLAQRPDLLEQVARRGLAPPASPHALRDAGQLYASVRRAQHDGFAVESERSAPGWTCVAALLPGATDKRAMIGATLPVGRANAREIIRSVLRAFEAISVSETAPTHFA